jgi:hypothetical protein
MQKEILKILQTNVKGFNFEAKANEIEKLIVINNLQASL